MAVVVVCMSEASRVRLYKVLSSLSILCLVLSVVYLGTLILLLERHRDLLRDLLIKELDFLFLHLLVLGVLVLLLTGVCLQLNRNVVLHPLEGSLWRMLLGWCVLVVLTCISVVPSLLSLMEMRSLVEPRVAQLYKYGMQRYMDSPDWQRAVDRVHRAVACCGVVGYADWYKAAWIPLTQLTGDFSLYAKVAQPSGRVLVPLVPDSCCRTKHSACGHGSWMKDNNSSWDQVKPADPGLIHPSGCSAAISHLLSTDTVTFSLLLLAMLLLQIFLWIGSRFLYSCTINSILLGKPRGRAPGCLFSNFSKGKTLIEYEKRCSNESCPSSAELGQKKTKWKCLDKLRKKRTEESESDAPGSSKEKKFRLPSPCISKLTQRFKKTQISQKEFEMDTKFNEETETEDEDQDEGDRNVKRNFSKKSKYGSEEETPLISAPRNVRVYNMNTEQTNAGIPGKPTNDYPSVKKNEKIDLISDTRAKRKLFENPVKLDDDLLALLDSARSEKSNTEGKEQITRKYESESTLHENGNPFTSVRSTNQRGKTPESPNNENHNLISQTKEVRALNAEIDHKIPFADTDTHTINDKRDIILSNYRIPHKPTEPVHLAPTNTQSPREPDTVKDFQKKRSMFERVARRLSPTKEKEKEVEIKNPTIPNPIKKETDRVSVVLRNYKLPSNV